MNWPQFFGTADVAVEADDNGLNAAIYVEVTDGGVGGQSIGPRRAFCALSIEEAAKLAEKIDAAIDELARTERARAEAKEARIAALKQTLAELESA